MNKIVKLDKQKNTSPVSIQSLSHDGRGISTIDNKTTFIAGALPGETVHCRITQKHPTYNEATLTEIIEASPERMTPPCQHFGLCGGCSLQHMSLAEQAGFKQATLLEQLSHFGKVTPTHILPPLNALSTGYRRKARLGAKFVIKKDKMLVGFREKSSRYLADLDGCEVLHPKVGTQFTILKDIVGSLSCYKHIPQIEIAIGDTETALVFRHLEPLTDDDKSKLVTFGKTHDFHIYLQPNPPAKVHKIFPDDNDERLTYSLPDQNITFRFHPLDFTQVHLEMNRLMVDQALAHLDLTSEDDVLDLFCGIGNFSLPMARLAKTVTGIEGSMEMVERASENSLYNNISNTCFFAENLMAESIDSAWVKQRYDKILLDPPRAGAKEVIPHIGKLGASRIVYISCNPATLARDAGLLVHQHNYELTHAGIMNMFPHTAHVEAMAVFELKK